VSNQGIGDDRCCLAEETVLADRIAGNTAEIDAGSDRDFVALLLDFLERRNAREVNGHLTCRCSLARRVDAGQKHRPLTMSCDQLQELWDRLRCLYRGHKKTGSLRERCEQSQ